MRKIVLGIILSLFLFGNCFALRLPEVPKERCLEIYGEINDKTFREIAGKLIELDKTDGDIRIYINSIGGFVVYGLAIIDVIKTLRNDVQTVALGQAISMAVPILVVGTKGKRAIGKHTSVLFHNVSFCEEDVPASPFFIPEEEGEWTEEEQEEWWEERTVKKLVQKFQIFLSEIIYEHTKVTHRELSEWYEKFLFGDIILEYEIVDGYYEGEK